MRHVHLASHELLIIDKLGFVPLSKTSAELLFGHCQIKFAGSSLPIPF